jgi:hypothetical protein
MNNVRCFSLLLMIIFLGFQEIKVKEKTKKVDLDPRERLHTANAKVQERDFLLILIFGNKNPYIIWQILNLDPHYCLQEWIFCY